jgi:positive regulator of sigma E activity
MTEDSGEDRGLVSAVNGNQITVELIRGGGCKSCTMQGLCFRKSTPGDFYLKSDISLQVGDSVQLEISAGGRTWLPADFGLPLLLLFTGFLLALLSGWWNRQPSPSVLPAWPRRCFSCAGWTKDRR